MTLSRGIAGLGAAVVLIALGVVQVASMALYGDLARAPALPALLPAALGIRIGRPLGTAGVPGAIRSAYAQALLHRGDTSAAAAIVDRLPGGGAAADLRGQLAEIREQPNLAINAYAQAGDFERAQRLIEVAVSAGRFGDAIEFEDGLAAALGGSGQATVRARALWRLGQLLQVRAVAEPGHARELIRRSLHSYERALEIAPNEETYLLAAGQEALTAGDKPLATHYYERALDAVPNSSAAQAGLATARS